MPTDSILRTVEEAGFSIAMSKEMYLSKEQAEEFYEEHRGKDYFESLVNNMTRFVLSLPYTCLVIINCLG